MQDLEQKIQELKQYVSEAGGVVGASPQQRGYI